jgi:hypothetical protein
MSNYHHLLRANKRQGIKAADFNRLAENLESAKTRSGPRYFLAKKSATQAINILANGAPVTVTFDTEVADTESMFNAGTITIPSDARWIRAIASLDFTAEVNISINAILAAGDYVNVQQFGYGTTQDGIRAMNIDTGWVPYIPGGSKGVLTVHAPVLSSWTINNDQATWLCVEVMS